MLKVWGRIAGIILFCSCSQNYSDKESAEALADNNYRQVNSQGEKNAMLEQGGGAYQSEENSSGARQSLKGISVLVPPGWLVVPPASSMRLAEYHLSGEAADAADASLAVFYFGPNQGGSVEANIERWQDQFEQSGGEASGKGVKHWEKKIGEIALTLVDISGTYNGGMGPMGQSEAPKEGYRMLGGIAQAPAGLFFFKMVGPVPTVELWTESFEQYMDSVLPE